MVSTTAVKRALAALATRTDTATRPYAAVIDEGEAALGDVRRAAGFVDAVGLDRLDEAVTAAENAGNDAAAGRGREALDAYRRFRAVAAGEATPADPPRDPSAPSTTPTDPSCNVSTPSDGSAPRAGGPSRGDHFRSGPGTPKPNTRQRLSR